MALAVSLLLPRGVDACTPANWLVEERVLHRASGIGGLGEAQTDFSGGVSTGRQLTTQDRQALLAAAVAAERTHVCALGLPPN